MKLSWCCLALGALPALGQPSGGGIAPFAIYSRFEHEPFTQVQDSLKRELTAIMSPVGLDFEWRSLAGPLGAETFADLAVVTFKGTCKGTCDDCALTPQQVDPHALGWTHRMDGHILHFSDVDCDRIRTFLSRALIALPPQDRPEAFGRAAGRVLAHELYHVFTQTAHHGSSGVAKAVYTVQELMSSDFHFEAMDLRAMAALSVIPGRPASSRTPLGRSLFAESGCMGCHGRNGEGTSRGPSLRSAGNNLEPRLLTTRLSNKASEMYRRARALGLVWPSLSTSDIEGLVSYLKANSE
jgi:mono/diheme cytochrome c family protein